MTIEQQLLFSLPSTAHFGPPTRSATPTGDTTSAEFIVPLPTLALGPATTCASADFFDPTGFRGRRSIGTCGCEGVSFDGRLLRHPNKRSSRRVDKALAKNGCPMVGTPHARRPPKVAQRVRIVVRFGCFFAAGA